MKQTKLVEIRDRATLIPALAIRVIGDGDPLLRRAGFGSSPRVVLVHLLAQEAAWDPYCWDVRLGRTMKQAHLWLQDHWDEIRDGGVVDVEFILGETATPKPSECPR